MKSNVQALSDCQRRIQLEVPVQEILDKYDEVYNDFSKNAQVPGFRTGKAPRHVLETHYSSKVKEEVLSQLISQSYQKAISENKLEPIAYPEIKDVKFENNKPLTFTATVDIKPEVKIKNYKGIKVKKAKAVVSQDELDKTLNYLRENLAAVSPILEDRPLKEGDFLLGDIECFVDGTCIDKRQNVLLFLGPGKTKDDNFTQQLFGAKAGETRKVNMVLPKDYPKSQYALKQAEFNISVKQIKEKKLPELDDALAKQIGNYQSIDELKQAIKKDLTAKKEAQVKLNMEEQILEYLGKENNFSVPPSLVNRRFEYLLEQAKHKLGHQGFKKEEIEKESKSLEEKLKPEAEKQVKIYFILNEIAQAEKVKVTPEEMEERYDYLSVAYGKSKDEIKKEVEEHNLAADLEEEILREKTVDFLVKVAKIEEE